MTSRASARRTDRNGVLVMTLRLSRHFLRTGARLLAFALLFSALSPALASLLLGDRAGVSARFLGLQTADVELAAICHEGGATATPDSPVRAPGHHEAGGVYCSFCLAAADITAIPPAMPQGRPEPPRSAPVQVHLAIAPLEIETRVHSARGPPLELC